MDLDDRKIKILNAIIQTYLYTGEPVGSRTISKVYRFEFKFSDDSQRDVRFGGYGLHRSAPHFGRTNSFR